MNQNPENKLEQKDKLISFYHNNKNKFFILIGILIITLSIFSYHNYNNSKKNILVSEKFVEAGLLLAAEEKNKATSIYIEIIKSKNEFYSILALNNILEKNLVSDKNEILKYFNLLENDISSKEKNDLIKFKKALFLLKKSNTEESLKILNELIESNSSLKNISQDIIKN